MKVSHEEIDVFNFVFGSELGTHTYVVRGFDQEAEALQVMRATLSSMIEQVDQRARGEYFDVEKHVMAHPAAGDKHAKNKKRPHK